MWKERRDQRGGEMGLLQHFKCHMTLGGLEVLTEI